MASLCPCACDAVWNQGQLFTDPPSSYSVQFKRSLRTCSSLAGGSWSAQLGRAAHYWFLHRCKSSTCCAVLHGTVHTAKVCHSPQLQRG
uniref:Uncharacterized protein n=1 Tax=Triticum urartu TaxID=4572 RepID=A0A8R7PVG8_TRIUA